MIFEYFDKKKRARLREQPFPDEWRELLDRNVPYVKVLSPEERKELEGLIHVFLAEKSFEGCGGLELTDEIRVTIAAQACLLLLGRDVEPYPELDVILVYPSAYKGPMTNVRDGVVIEGDSARLGEASTRGILVLSWDDVLRGAADVRDGHNVVIHEFAHALDHEDGSSDGAPPLSRRANYAPWARVFGAEYEKLIDADEHRKKTIIDKYGATNPAEFFAVVTETFFEKPLQMRAKHPELYEQLKQYYRQDPAERLSRR
jgi:Mlc titration factor MtfA (ptsG expression regulator)